MPNLLGKASPKTVYIPFKPQFREPMLKGMKTMTSRNKRYGQVGDTFTIFGATFELIRVFQASLGFIATERYCDEGFLNPQGFVDIWKQLHPRKGWVPDQMVWVHEFKRQVK